MVSEATLSHLQNVELLRGLSADEISQVAAACTEVSYQAGDIVFQEGREERALRIILDGTVEIDIAPPRAGDRMLTQLTPGAVFGESSFFHAAPHSATARCLTDVRLLRLDRTRYEEMVKERNCGALQLAANAADLLAASLQQTDRWIVAMLEAEQDHKNHQAWLNFRERMGRSASVTRSGPVVGPGSTAASA